MDRDKRRAEERARLLFQACAEAKSSREPTESLTIKEIPELIERVDPLLAKAVGCAQQEQLFQMLDANKDGEISVEEFTSAFGKLS